MRPRRTCSGRGPIAVVGGGGTWTARLLRTLTGCPVKELTPCQAVAAAEKGEYFQAVVVENFEPRDPRQLSGCAAARWALATRTGVTVVGLDDGEGRLCRNLAEILLPVIASELRLGKDWNYASLFLGMLEATAKLLRVPKYHVYTAERLQRQAQELAGREDADMEALPAFSRLILNR